MPSFDASTKKELFAIADNFNVEDAQNIKNNLILNAVNKFIHFACTREDIKNMADNYINIYGMDNAFVLWGRTMHN